MTSLSAKTQLSLNSYEYKVMLHPDKFNGNMEQVIEQAKVFWSAFETLIKDMVIKTKGSLDELDENRAIRFYDTKEHLLYNSSYIFRERVDMVNPTEIETETEDIATRKATLKFRNRDRSIAQNRDMSAADMSESKTKFEEDLKFEEKAGQVSIISLYSFSTKQPISESQTFTKLDDIMALYPDLKSQLTPEQGDLPLHIVGNLTAREIVLKGGKFQLEEGSTEVKAKSALVLWYKGEVNDTPAVVEFSFKCEDDDGEYTEKTLQIIEDIFAKLQDNSLEEWVNIKGLTKTKFVYSLDDFK